MDTTRAAARRMDREDPLSAFRRRFHLLPGTIYMDGNSLGLQPRTAKRIVARVLAEWRDLAIDGYSRGAVPWFQYTERLRDPMARLVGAVPGSVIVTGTTTVNLHTLLATFYRPGGRRRKIVATAVDFPSDIYALQSHIRLHGGDVEADLVRVRPRSDGTVAESDLVDAMTDDVALALVPTVLYHTGQLLDVGRLAGAARAAGVAIGLDAAHGVGCVPHHLDDWGVDFAVWCTYKYLNAGPAAPAALYVHPRHHERLPGLAGWWGGDKDRQFDMDHAFVPAADAGRWQISGPSVLAMAGLEAALEVLAEADIEAVRAGSLARTDYLIALCEATGLTSDARGFDLATPREHARRGGHVALRHVEAARVAKALKARGIVPDHRPPDIVRLAPVALYTTFEECWQVVRALRAIADSGAHERFPPGRETVA